MSKQIIYKPVITEKAERLTEKLNQYTFYVNRGTNKIEIKKAIEEQFDVEVVAVKTMVMPAKARTRYTKSGFLSGKTNVRKKAVVTLAKDDEIDLYSNI